MTVKPTPPPATRSDPGGALTTSISSSAAAGSGTGPKPASARARARPWTTWTRIVRYVSLYYLVNVIGIGITVEGFRWLLVAADDDLGAQARAVGVVAAGSCLRAAAAAVVETLWDTPYNVVMVEFALVTTAVALYAHFTMDAFGCACQC